MIDSGLVFDVGANAGQDTEAFLARGLRLVAVEANPKLCADMRKRFADEISDGRLVIVDKAISGSRTVIFHLNSADLAWGAISASYAARGQALAGKIERTEVETTTLTEIIRARGPPRYLKVDIEGADILGLLGLFHADHLDRAPGVFRRAALSLRSLAQARLHPIPDRRADEGSRPASSDVGLPARRYRRLRRRTPRWRLDGN